MSERRSSRSRQTVKYSGFDDESDDDFADSSSRPSKKPKSSKGDETTKKTKSAKDKEWNLDVDIVDSSLIKSQKSSKTRRAPLSEKIYEREIQEALELSILETGGSQDVLNQSKDSNKPQPVSLTIDIDVNDSSHLRGSLGSVNDHNTLRPQECPENPATKAAPSLRYTPGTVVVDDSIELLEEKGDSNIDQSRKSGRQARKRPQVVDSDDERSDESDFKPESDGSESSRSGTGAEISDEDDSKSDLGDSPKKRKQTKPKINKSAANKTISKPVKRGVKNAPRMQQASEVSASKPSSGVSISSETTVKSINASSKASDHPCQKLPTSLASQWKPPSRASPNQTSTILRSPSSGLRLGLSRNQRVKPLHPSVNVV